MLNTTNMIAVSDPQEFVPSGRQQAQNHPGLLKSFPINNNLLNEQFEKVTLKDLTNDEWWILRKTPSSKDEKISDNISDKINEKNLFLSEFIDNSFKNADLLNKTEKRLSDMNISKNKSYSNDNKSSNIPHTKLINNLDSGYIEDELYVKNNLVIWSRGLAGGLDDINRKTICCYTIPLPVKHALWCTFHRERPNYNETISDNSLNNQKGVPIKSICIIDVQNIRVFTNEGEDFITAIPFQIAKVWPTKFGIFLEKDIEDNSNFQEKSTLFSLEYPLDEVRPVAIDYSNNIQILNNNNLKIVFTSETPSICVTYDSLTKQHSVYKIRKINSSEYNMEKSFCTNQSNRLRSRLSLWDNFKTYGVLSPMNTSYPISSPSVCHLSRSHSSMATMSRGQSPASNAGSPWLMKQSRLHSYKESECTNSNKSFFDNSKSMAHVNSSPKICLDYIWTDNISLQSESLSGPASKAFLCDDLIGNWYLCYIIKFNLVIVRCDFATMQLKYLTNINAKDALPILNLHMMAILEQSGNVTLYSGINIVGKLHIGGTLVQYTPSPHVKRSLPKFSPYPKRSSLLPTSSNVDPTFEDHLFSPVLPEKNDIFNSFNIRLDVDIHEVNIIGLSDPVGNRLTLQYSDGTFYRINLPNIASSSLVSDCLSVLRQCLPKDLSMNVLTRWYSIRNVIGTENLTSDQEWNMFKDMILELIGYDDNDNDRIKGKFSMDSPVTPSNNPKRSKSSTKGNESDWQYILNSDYHRKGIEDIIKLMKLNLNLPEKSEIRKQTTINKNSKLFQYIKIIHFCFHLLYEDLKLNMYRLNDLKDLVKLLNIFSLDLNLINYSIHYWKDFPQLCTIKSNSIIIEENDLKTLPLMTEQPVNIMKFIYNLIKGHYSDSYPYLKNINDHSKDIIQISGVIVREEIDVSLESLIITMDFNRNIIVPLESPLINKFKSEKISEEATLLMAKKSIGDNLNYLPHGISLLFYGALWKCRENPPLNWPKEAYYLIERDDLAKQSEKMINNCLNDDDFKLKLKDFESNDTNSNDNEINDGMDDLDNNILKLRFSTDVRVNEVRKMLQSSKPVTVVLERRPGVLDHEFIEEQERHLYAICTRTMALAVGRGMVTLRTSTPIITEPLQPPPLCLTGKEPVNGTTIELNHIDVPSNMNLWPLFHNGVANGLRINTNADNIDNTWIIFNKPKNSTDDQQMEYAGFLMALGLNGHLKNLEVLSAYDCLSKVQEMTSIGILIGLSAAFRGTSNSSLTKTLSIHVEALLPPTSMELDVPQNLQVAALLGIGLLYQNTAHRYIIEVLMSEIGRPPGPEMENSVDRESYSLSAGLALGLVVLKQAGSPCGVSDLNVPDILHYYMVGGKRRSLTGAQKDKYKIPSFQIKEGSYVNLDVTAPGATLALGLMYLGSHNKAIADWMTPPETQYLLDFVRPDFLMLRILSKSLIMWNDIEPTKDWVNDQVPSTIMPFCMVKPTISSSIDYEAMNQAYCNIITGACFAIGLKFAGSADEEAFETLMHFCHMFTKLTSKSIAELAGKPTIETCLNVLLLSVAAIMAGTGNLDVIRLVRYLRRRVGFNSSAVVTYGCHLATHMALGLLFLGGGRYTLSNSPANVAALICAFYPKFPTHSNDNRYHLQAFRHLYVLAAEPRLIIPKDVFSNKNCYANLKIVKLDGSTHTIKGPGIIPELNTLSKVAIDDDRYWPVIFEKNKNWKILEKILSTNGCIRVKQRAGCLSYVADKFGYHSELARTLANSESIPWNPSPLSIISFTSNDKIKHFCDIFLINKSNNKYGKSELKIRQILTRITYDAVVKDKLMIIPIYGSIYKMIEDLNIENSVSLDIWQLKIIFAQTLDKQLTTNLFYPEIVIAIEQEFINIINNWQNNLKNMLKLYVNGNDFICEKNLIDKLAIFIVYYELPFKMIIHEPYVNYFHFLYNHKAEYSILTLKKVFEIIQN